MPPKKPSLTAWTLCEKCGVNLIAKDVNQHVEICPALPLSSSPSTAARLPHCFIHNNTLYGLLDIKVNQAVKGLSKEDIDNLVFLSQATIQLCDLVIGEWCQLQSLDGEQTCARIVWPTIEKSATAVLLTKQSKCKVGNEFKLITIIPGLDLSFQQPNIHVTVKKCGTLFASATRIRLKNVNNACVEFSPELQSRVQKIYTDRLLMAGNYIGLLFYGRFIKFQIESIDNVECDNSLDERFASTLHLNENRFSRVVEGTMWTLCEYSGSAAESIALPKTPSDKLGGLGAQIKEIEYLMELALTQSSTSKYKCKTVLLHGASGTGKTTLAQTLAETSSHNANVITINLWTLYSRVYGESGEDSMECLLKQALLQTPAIVIIDEIHMFCPMKSNKMGETEKRIISKLTRFFDVINSDDSKAIFVMAITNQIDSIDGSFRRFGRLDREIEIPTPTSEMRVEILQTLLSGGTCTNRLSGEELRIISNAAHGFVGADLMALCATALLNAGKRTRRNSSRSTTVMMELGDLQVALTQVNPSAMRQVQVDVPNVKWADIGGQDNLKLILRQSVEWPLKHPEVFVRMGITPPKGILMFGPPGCSKTMIAQALATETHLNFLSIKGPELFSKWVGESERAIRDIFRKARQVAPCVIFFDEIDALGGERSAGGAANSNSVQERVLTQLLTELDGITPLRNITILAATNRPDRIDRALLRPGRLDRIVHVPLPDTNTRREIFKLKFSQMPIHNMDCTSLVERTEGYSGAEINALCHEAALKALEENFEALTVEERHFDQAFQIVTPRTSPSLIEMYKNYMKS